MPMGAGPYSTASIAQHLRAAEHPRSTPARKLGFYGVFCIFRQARAEFRLGLLQASQVAARSGVPSKSRTLARLSVFRAL